MPDGLSDENHGSEMMGEKKTVHTAASLIHAIFIYYLTGNIRKTSDTCTDVLQSIRRKEKIAAITKIQLFLDCKEREINQ